MNRPPHHLRGAPHVARTAAAFALGLAACAGDPSPPQGSGGTSATTATTTSTGAGGTGGTGGGGPAACTEATVADACGKSTECKTTACVSGTCSITFAAKGAACTVPAAGQCDGKGDCLPDHCLNGKTDGDETDADCGGSCLPCANGRVCKSNDDCASASCSPLPNSPATSVCSPCATPLDCAADHYCDAASRACLPDKANGAACTDAAECPGNYCADGVCCSSACDVPCAACSVAQGATKDGTCTLAARKNVDDAGSCDATQGGCGGPCTCDEVGACVLQPALEVVSGDSHSCARFESGAVKCWGANPKGQLGLEDTNARGDSPNEMGKALPRVNLGTGKKAIDIAAGGESTCAVLDDGSVKCWGANNLGQLGLGDGINRGDNAGSMGDKLPAVDLGTGKKAVNVAQSGSHACALLDDGSVKCWGRNDFGALGLGDKVSRGGSPGQMGDKLPPVNLGTGKKALALATGGNGNTCALLVGGTVKCWGNGYYGTNGQGDKSDRGTSPTQMGDNLPQVDLGAGNAADALAMGSAHVCAHLTDGQIKCWGRNDSGQLGLGDTTHRGDAPGQMGDKLPAVDLGKGTSALFVTAGYSHSCATLKDGSVKCWGGGYGGGLGQGGVSNIGTTAGQMGDALPAIDLGTNTPALRSTAGMYFSCAALSGGSYKCWGDNGSGQLGLGDKMRRGDKPGQMGMALPLVDLTDP